MYKDIIETKKETNKILTETMAIEFLNKKYGEGTAIAKEINGEKYVYDSSFGNDFNEGITKDELRGGLITEALKVGSVIYDDNTIDKFYIGASSADLSEEEEEELKKNWTSILDFYDLNNLYVSHKADYNNMFDLENTYYIESELEEFLNKCEEKPKIINSAVNGNMTNEEAVELIGNRAKELANNPQVRKAMEGLYKNGTSMEEIESKVLMMAIATLYGIGNNDVKKETVEMQKITDSAMNWNLGKRSFKEEFADLCKAHNTSPKEAIKTMVNMLNEKNKQNGAQR